MNIAYVVGYIMLVIVGTMVFIAKKYERDEEKKKNNK